MHEDHIFQLLSSLFRTKDHENYDKQLRNSLILWRLNNGTSCIIQINNWRAETPLFQNDSPAWEFIIYPKHIRKWMDEVKEAEAIAHNYVLQPRMWS